MITLALRGNTYGIKEVLKNLGFRWDKKEKAWIQDFENSKEQYVNELSTRWISEGVYGYITKQ